VNLKKNRILDAAIDLFAEYGIRNVSNAMIAEKLNTVRTSINYYFPESKDEIIDSIITIFDGMIEGNIRTITDKDLSCGDAESILSSLFLAFEQDESERGRKINKIIFAEHGYEPKIKAYLEERFYQKKETRFTCIFDRLIESGIVEPFDTAEAARVLNKIFIAYALEDSFDYPFEIHEMPQCLDCLRKDCMFVLKNVVRPK